MKSNIKGDLLAFLLEQTNNNISWDTFSLRLNRFFLERQLPFRFHPSDHVLQGIHNLKIRQVNLRELPVGQLRAQLIVNAQYISTNLDNFACADYFMSIVNNKWNQHLNKSFNDVVELYGKKYLTELPAPALTYTNVHANHSNLNIINRDDQDSARSKKARIQ